MLRYARAAVVLVCMIGTAAAATARTGEIAGVVVDTTGGVLPGATVTLTGAAGAATTQADAEGRFTFGRLPAGVYAVTVFLSGFGEATVDDITVGADPVALSPITLRLGAFEEAAVVTATRIEEPLQEVPMSISAVTGADIERRAIENLTELARWTPGLTVVDQGARGSNVVIVRGLNTDSLNAPEFTGNNYNNGVATYLGDIPLAVDLRLRDVERVEVLLGPQGTLYGAGTLAGAVRYLPRRPDTERRELEVRGDLFGLAHGGAPGSDAGFTFNLPLVRSRLALRGVVDRFANPGFIDYDYLLRTPGVSEPEPDPSDPAAVAANLYSEPDANTEDTLSARLSLLWEATPNLSALFAYHLQDQRVGGRQVNHAAAFDTGRYVSAHRYPEPNDRRNELLSLELNWGLGGAELTTAAGYSRFSQQGQRDQTDLLIQAFGIGGLLPGTYPGLSQAQATDPDITAADLTAGFRTFSAYTREDGREERLNWETRLVSTGDGPWRWVGGAFFNRYDSRGTSFELAPGLTAFSGVTPVLGGNPVSEPVEYYSLGRQDVEERALCGEISRDLGRRWRVTAGGRWFGYGIATGNLTEFPYTPMYSSPYSDHESDDGGVLFKGSVSYRLDDETNVYFTRSQGYRIGGGNNFRVCSDEEITLLTDADPGNDPPQSGCIYADQALIEPDTTTNYEVGLRRSWNDERVTFSGTLFHVDWTDIQVAGLTPFSAQPITLNGGGAVSRGVEIASAVDATGALRFRGSWSYTQAELSMDSPGLLDGGADAFEGDRLSGAPRQQGSLLASYAALLGGDLAFDVQYGYSHVGDVLTRIGMRAG
ncbi:MAG: TonB-dependent receptor, partial [Acidobacteria bacterium]|nr:TonB-dependent receptor [Acidobacteriota bacterium]